MKTANESSKGILSWLSSASETIRPPPAIHRRITIFFLRDAVRMALPYASTFTVKCSNSQSHESWVQWADRLRLVSALTTPMLVAVCSVQIRWRCRCTRLLDSHVVLRAAQNTNRLHISVRRVTHLLERHRIFKKLDPPSATSLNNRLWQPS